MAITQKQLRTELRQNYFNKLIESFEQIGEEVLVIGENTIAIPCLNSQGEEEFIKIVVSVPIGSKGEPFDGYTLQEDYKFKLEQDEQKRQKKEEQKKKKMERDRAYREKKKANQEKRGNEND